MTPALNVPEIDQTLLALADPTRRAIIGRLSKGEARVTELAKPFDMSLNAVSKHIRILERTKLVHRRIDGREHFLSFNPAPLDETLKWMNEQRHFWTTRLDLLEKILRDEDKMSVSKRKKNFKKKGKNI